MQLAVIDNTEVANTQTHYTVKELCAELGLSHTAVADWLTANNIEGRERQTGNRGVQPMEYEVTPMQFAICKQQQQQLQIKKFVDNQEKTLEETNAKLVAKTDGEVTAAKVIHDSMCDAVAKCTDAKTFLLMARQMAEQAAEEAANRAKALAEGFEGVVSAMNAELDDLRSKLDRLDNEMTVLTYVVKHKYAIDESFFGQITSWLKGMGRVPLRTNDVLLKSGRVVPAAVWAVSDLQFAKEHKQFDILEEKTAAKHAKLLAKAVTE